MNKGEAHHVLFSRKIWSSQDESKVLRCNRWLQPRLDTDSHRELHRNLASVPLPDHFMAARVLRLFRPVINNHLETIDNLMFAFDEAARHPRAGSVERQVGHLIIESLEIQLPYIKEGLYQIAA